MLKTITTQFDSLLDQSATLSGDWEEKYGFVLDFCVRIIPKIVSSERCSIFIKDPLNEDAWLKAGVGENQNENDFSLDGDSIAGEVIATGKSIIVNDLSQNAEIHKRLGNESGFVTRDLLCVPIRSLDGKEVTGAIQLLNRMYGHTFSDADLKLMEEVALVIEQFVEGIYYHSQSHILLKRAALITKVTVTIGMALILGLTGAYGLWVILTHLGSS